MEHHFQVKRGDLELSFSGERDFVEAQIAAFLPLIMGASGEAPRVSLDVRARTMEDAPSAEAQDTIAELPRVSPTFRPKRNISLVDLAGMKSATAPTDLVVVAGYYLEKYMQLDTYSPADLQEHLRTVPAWDCQVVDEVLPITVMQGYMECLRDERYTLTYKGQTYVRDGLA